MVLKPRKLEFWVITIVAEHIMRENEKEFVVQLASEEAYHVVARLSFVLDEVFESRKYIKLVITGTKASLENLLVVLRSNLPYKISYSNAG